MHSTNKFLTYIKLNIHLMCFQNQLMSFNLLYILLFFSSLSFFHINIYIYISNLDNLNNNHYYYY